MDKCREDFETWYESRYGYAKIKWLENSGEYDYTSVQCMWGAWQASRAALVVELPDHVNDMDSAPMLYDSIVEQLKSLGIRYE